MLLINQQVDYDFANKETIYIDSFKYKQGEVDGNGIDLTLKNISPKPNTFFLVNWLYRDQYDYVYIPNLSTEVQGDKVVVYPPQAVLRPGVVGFEIIAVEIENGVPVGQLIGPTIIVPVAPSLVSDGDAVIEDADISKTVEIISDQTELKNALEALNSWLTGKENARKTEETRRQNLASQKAGELDTAKSNLDTAIASANSATSNANAKAALADTAATNANTAATNANASATATNTSATNANTAKSNADAKKTLADTAKTNADGKKTLADQKKALADTAKSNADTKKAAADANAVILEGAPAEVTAARVAGNGTTHDSLKKSLDANFVELSSRIPTNVGVSGIENVTVNNSLAGEVSGVELTGRTLVNLLKGSNHTYKKTNGLSNVIDNATVLNQPIKPNTVYTLFVNITRNTTTTSGSSWSSGIFCGGFSGFNYFTGAGAITNTAGYTGTKILKLTTLETLPTDARYDGTFPIYLTTHGDATLTGYELDMSMVLLEGDHTDKPLEFFEGLKSAEVAEINTHGVNLVDNSKNLFGTGMNDGGLIGTTGAHVNRTLTDFISVSDVKTYTTYGGAGTWFNFYDDNKTCINPTRVNVANNRPFSIPSGSKFARFFIGDPKSTTMYLYEVTGSEPSTYVPYSSSKITLPSPIILRSLPNGVADTYDFDTQTLTRRCGEVVLDGEINDDVVSYNNWSSSTPPSNLHACFYVRFKNLSGLAGIKVDKFSTYNIEDIRHKDIEAMSTVASSTNSDVQVQILKSKLTTPDLAGFKAWLAQNPTTVVYQLATPTTEVVENSGQLRSYDYQTTIYADSVVPCDIKANVPISFKSAINSIAQTNLSIEQPSLLEVQTQQEQNADELTALQLAIVDLYEERI